MLVGAISVVGRFARVGCVQNFIGTVVLLGFKAGAALLIASTQVPKIFGVEGSGGNFFARIAHLAAEMSHAHIPSAILGLSALLALVALARFFPGRPSTLLVVTAVLILVHSGVLAGLGIRLAGHIPDGLPLPAFPLLGLCFADLEYACLRQENRSALLGGARIANRNLRRIEISIVAYAKNGYNAGRFQKRIQPVRILRRQPLHIEARLLSTFEVVIENAGVLGTTSDLQTAGVNPTHL
jgi:hypothetical protein